LAKKEKRTASANPPAPRKIWVKEVVFTGSKEGISGGFGSGAELLADPGKGREAGSIPPEG
jgi:hypothetical protein